MNDLSDRGGCIAADRRPAETSPPAKAPAPRAPRALLDLFSFYHDETGIEGLIENIDTAAMLPRHVYYAVHDRPPESIERAFAERIDKIPDLLAAALRSTEFRENLPRLLLAAYPEKRRIFFVHIPKCAGSNLTAHLSGRYISLNTNMLDARVVPERRLFRAIKHFVLEARVSDTVFIHGHNHLQTYENWRALRFDDRVITVLREPAAMLISQVNYILTRMFTREEPPAPDGIAWRRTFDVPATAEPPPRHELLGIAARILRDDDVMPPNIITRFLGAGRCDVAAARIVTRDVEVTDMDRYAAWCRARWGIDSARRINPSVSYLAWDDFGAAAREVIRAKTVEDDKLHQMVRDRLTVLGKPSLTGRELVGEAAPARPAA